MLQNLRDILCLDSGGQFSQRFFQMFWSVIFLPALFGKNLCQLRDERIAASLINGSGQTSIQHAQPGMPGHLMQRHPYRALRR